jgi:hypothetical protein
VLREIEHLDDVRKYTASQIREIVAALPEYQGRVPKVRAVQGHIKRYRDRQGTEPWRFIDSTPEDARLVFPILVRVFRVSEGRRRLTRTEGEWIVRVGKAAPSLDDTGRWRYAAAYMRWIQAGKDTSDLDYMLGIKVMYPNSPIIDTILNQVLLETEIRLSLEQLREATKGIEEADEQAKAALVDEVQPLAVGVRALLSLYEPEIMEGVRKLATLLREETDNGEA